MPKPTRALPPLPTWAELCRSHNCQSLSWIAGTDEVGRGPLAGPVVAATVCVAPRFSCNGLADSKTLTRSQRERLFDLLTSSPDIDYSIAVVSHNEIDRINILQASLLAMRQSFASLKCFPEMLFVDGNRIVPALPCRQVAVVKGDAIVPAISAASIIAKVTRDRIMENAERDYPAFSFARHVGYPTPQHLLELREHGVTPLHRQSFRPVRELSSQS